MKRGKYMDMEVLKELANIDIRSVDKESLVDLKDVVVDMGKSKQERISDFVRQIKNPYCFICNGIIVKMQFEKNAEALEDKLNDYFLSL